jgi:hypothetical protein
MLPAFALDGIRDIASEGIAIGVAPRMFLAVRNVGALNGPLFPPTRGWWPDVGGQQAKKAPGPF